MVQVLKPQVRDRIRRAALAEFAATGAAGAKMSSIAERAALGVATLYNYYDSKETLFLDVISSELARKFEALVERRVRALAGLSGTLDSESQDDASATANPDRVGSASAKMAGGGHASGEELLRFWVEHRLESVILLDRAEGTAFAGFGRRFVRRLQQLTLAALRDASPGLKLSPRQRLVLTTIFENTRRMLATILETCETEEAIRESFATFWPYQIAGLRGLTEALAGTALTKVRRTRRA